MSKAFLCHKFTKNIFDIVNHVYQILIFIHFHYMKISIGLFVLSVWPIENQSMSIGFFCAFCLAYRKPVNVNRPFCVFCLVYSEARPYQARPYQQAVHINRPSVLCFLSGLCHMEKQRNNI